MKRLITALAVTLLVGLTYLFGWSNFFSVKKITIDVSDTKVAQQIEELLAQPPATISMGEKLARVDKRVIASRLKNLVWIDGVSIGRNFFTGEVRISLVSRQPIARFDGSNGGTRFLGSNLELFTLSNDAIQSATSSSSFDWRALPVITAANPTAQTLGDVKSFIDQMKIEGLQIRTIDISSPGELVSGITVGKQMVEVRWGSVQELKLKKRVLDALLAAPENKKVKAIDLTDPQNPTVK